jgi:hypothetical protein
LSALGAYNILLEDIISGGFDIAEYALEVDGTELNWDFRIESLRDVDVRQDVALVDSAENLHSLPFIRCDFLGNRHNL